MTRKLLLYTVALVVCLLCTTSVVAEEAYACYTPENTTLSFYYDNLRSTRPGTTYDLNTEFELPGWIMDWLDMENHVHPAAQVVFDPSFADARPTATSYWFLGMSNLQSISGINYLNTSEVTTMSFMFGGCSSLTSLDLSGFNTANVIYMEAMFNDCYSLTNLDLSSFNTANVGDMSDMFEDCISLTSLDLSSFNTANARFIPYMFVRCSNLTNIYAGSGWNLPADAYSEGMFQDCTSLVGCNGTAYDASHVDGEYAHIDGGPSNPGYLSAVGTEAYACYTPSDKRLTFYCDNKRSIRPGTTYDLNTGDNNPDWITDGTYTSIYYAKFDPSFAYARPTSTYSWFGGVTQLLRITGMNYLNTSEVTSMGYMFQRCYNLTKLDVSGFITDNVTDMTAMFYNCSQLTSLDLSSFSTANVMNMDYMFNACTGLRSLDVSGFNTANVTDMSYMFAECNFLDIDLSSFNTANVSFMSGMFQNCSNLTTINVGAGWSTQSVTWWSWSSDMFKGCSSIIGGQGTTYDASHVDASYAHIDGGPGNPGYFTGTACIPGDLDGNSQVGMDDLTKLINYLLTNDATGINLDAADVDNMQGVNMDDLTKLINYLLTNAWP